MDHGLYFEKEMVCARGTINILSNGGTKCETQTINNTPIVHAPASSLSFKMAKNTGKKNSCSQ
jgi:hypothetical protein